MRVFIFSSSPNPYVDYFYLNGFVKRNIKYNLINIYNLIFSNELASGEQLIDCDFDFEFEELDLLKDFINSELSQNDVCFINTSSGLVEEIRGFLVDKGSKVLCDTTFGLPINLFK